MRFLLGIFLSFNAMAITATNDSAIKASDINDQLSFLFRIFHKSGVQGVTYSGTSVQQVVGRSLNFTKKYDQTKLTLSYNDAFRVHSNQKMCTIYLEINGIPCTEGPLYKTIYTYNSDDINSLKVSATCSGIPKGDHVYSVKVKAASFEGAYTGGYCEFSWNNNSSYSMTLKETF